MGRRRQPRKQSRGILSGCLGLLFLVLLGVGSYCYINETGPGRIYDSIMGEADTWSPGIDLPIIGDLFSGSGDSQVSSDRYDPEYHLFYAMLSPEEQEDYRRILEGMLEQRVSVSLSGECTSEQVSRIFSAVLDDQPDIFWIDSSFSTIGSDKIHSVELHFLYSDDEIGAKRQELDQEVGEIVDPLRGLSAFEQERAVYDLLCERITYDGSGIDQGQTAYSALIEGRTVCSGYSRAFQLLMMQLGHPCSYASGQAQGVTDDDSGWEAHAWNVVQLDGTWYNVDATWGDTTIFDTEGISYRGFNATDSAMSIDHERQDLSIQLPSCTTEFDFESCFGQDAAVVSLESAGYQVNQVVDSPDQLASDVSARAADLVNGGQYVVVFRDMSQDQIDEALQSAIDSVASAYPGQSVSQSGSTQEYDSHTTFAVLRYELS